MPQTKIPIAWALRSSLKSGYSGHDLMSDLMAGIVVAIVAIPLGMALAIASGVSPQLGLYTVVISGLVMGVLGGSKHNVSGPTAAFVVLLLPVVQKHGVTGLYLAGFMAGILCLAYGAFGLGQFIRYVPHPVTTGFTSGIAVVIGFLQLKDFLGLTYTSESVHFVEKIIEVGSHVNSFRLAEFLTGVSTLGLIILSFKKIKKIPAPIIALAIVTVGTFLLKKLIPGFNVDTIDSRYSYTLNGETFWGIPQMIPQFEAAWTSSSSTQQEFLLSWGKIVEIFPSAFSISLLGSIESLLSALIAEGATQVKHDPNSELVGIGVANILCPFFGGIPATGAIARTTTNIRFGARSSLACLFHSLVTLLVIVLVAPIIEKVPIAALAALLIYVAYNMSERLHFTNILKNAVAEDRAVLLACFGLTVFFDMTVGVTAGVILACVLFIRRVAKLTHAQLVLENPEVHYEGIDKLPADTYLYKISGSLFFGVAERAMGAITNISDQVKKVVFDMSQVPMMDITGVVALDSAIKKLVTRGIKVHLVIPSAEVRRFIVSSSIIKQEPENVRIFQNIHEALV